ncbi:MAG: GNAT family N-acetyltransferase [Marinifilaceae bacterium]
METEVKHVENKNRFEVKYADYTAYLQYKLVNNALDIVSTYVPSELRGNGIAANLVRAAMEYAKQHKLQIIPTCPYVDTFIRRYPQYKELLV